MTLNNRNILLLELLFTWLLALQLCGLLRPVPLLVACNCSNSKKAPQQLASQAFEQWQAACIPFLLVVPVGCFRQL